MSHFKIFIPGAIGNRPEHLENIGLGDLVEGSHYHKIDGGVEHGGNGQLVSWAVPGSTMEFTSEDNVDWIEAFARGIYKKGRYWVLLDNQSLPNPTELERVYQHPGKMFKFGDGNQWRLTSPDNLPQDMRLNDDGTWRYVAQRKYHKYGMKCRDHLATFTAEFESKKKKGETEGELSFGDVGNLLIDSLSLNYRLTPEVIDRLVLFNTSNTMEPFIEVIRGAMSNIK